MTGKKIELDTIRVAIAIGRTYYDADDRRKFMPALMWSTTDKNKTAKTKPHNITDVEWIKYVLDYVYKRAVVNLQRALLDMKTGKHTHTWGLLLDEGKWDIRYDTWHRLCELYRDVDPKAVVKEYKRWRKTGNIESNKVIGLIIDIFNKERERKRR